MALPTKEDLYQTGLAAAVSVRPELATAPDDVVAMWLSGAAAIGDRIIGLAGQMYKGSYLDGAEGDVLTARAQAKGVQREEAAAAIGTLLFTRVTTVAQETVPAGTTVATDPDDDGVVIQAVTDSALIIAIGVGFGSVNATVTTTGPTGDVAAAAFSNIVTTISASTWTVTNAAGFAGGENEESDEALRERARIKELADQKATADALEYHTKSVPGVSVVAVTEDASGNVTTYVSDSTGASSPALVTLAEAAVEETVAAGAAWYVLGGSVLTQNVTLTLTARAGIDTNALFAKIQDAVIGRIAKLRQGDTLWRDYIRQAALNVDSDNLLTCTVVTPAIDIVPTASQVIRCDTVTAA